LNASVAWVLGIGYVVFTMADAESETAWENSIVTAKIVMVQGTTSHAGKSILTAALCRIYARRGLRVAPFKAQNMALNSFVTLEGGEIGRAQAYQARAAGLEPTVDMNPVLLKPNSDTGSQVIVLGKPVGSMKVREYHAYQQTVWPVVTAALDRLRAAFDVVVVEGAGSPAEINLRSNDIVNMRVARHANAPVLLVGDIDRGGVFASLFGTAMLVTPEERALIKGFIINKFRGDASLLDSGFEFLLERTGIPTLGVIPYLKGWKGEEEDSLGMDSTFAVPVDERKRELKIGVVRLPFISNYTDFDALASEPDVELVRVESVDDLRDVDALILPGTKSTIADLAWLREREFPGAIRTLLKRMIPVFGICGGYQMLGRTIADPMRVESDGGEVPGLGLLDVTTVFAADKRTERVRGEVASDVVGLDGLPLYGYEIHMGRSTCGSGVAPFATMIDGAGRRFEDGAVSRDGMVMGTYLHGVFDSAAFRRAWLNQLRASRRLEALPVATGEGADLDVLADHVERSLDMGRLEAVLGW
jgi:adenosylcobyric acid synthase